jgi:hypothetical protein
MQSTTEEESRQEEKCLKLGKPQQKKTAHESTKITKD